MYQYQGFWLFPSALFGAMLIQTDLKHRPTDIILSSFMKSGTTWLRSLMFTTINRSRFTFSDHPLLRKGPQECFPVLDYTNPKTTWLRTPRDPKDVLVSMWQFILQLTPKEMTPISIDRVFQMFYKGCTEYGPFWEASLKSPVKILFFKYEEIKRDPETHVKKLAEFMGVPISGQEEEDGVAKKIVEFCSLGHLASLEINKTGVYRANNGSVIPNQAFLRPGEVGDWKCHLTNEMKDQIDRITRDKFKDSGLTVGATLN